MTGVQTCALPISPTAASTALLEQFFSATNATGASLDTLVSGMKLLSDMKYRERAEALARSIAAETNAEREAVLKNILNEALRP